MIHEPILRRFLGVFVRVYIGVCLSNGLCLDVTSGGHLIQVLTVCKVFLFGMFGGPKKDRSVCFWVTST